MALSSGTECPLRFISLTTSKDTLKFNGTEDTFMALVTQFSVFFGDLKVGQSVLCGY